MSKNPIQDALNEILHAISFCPTKAILIQLQKDLESLRRALDERLRSL